MDGVAGASNMEVSAMTRKERDKRQERLYRAFSFVMQKLTREETGKAVIEALTKRR